ncbi:MAG: GspH/FimT family pseudopilin [Deltaproteobacteria bacterium]|nr:GspH/FimT family pseudopilin [Deltaproteobacteria bacterium]
MKRETGFTLVEMMIVVGLFAIVAAIAIPNFMSLLPGMRLNGAARVVMGDLMAARMKAVKLNHRTKVFFDSNTQYRICDDADNSGTVADGEGDVVTRNIQTDYNDVTLSSTAEPVFQSRGTASGTTVTVTNPSGSKSVKVAITGRVKIE